MFARLLFSTLLLGASMAGYAKEPATAATTPAPSMALTPQQQALQSQLNGMAPQLVKIATQVAQMIDKDKAGSVWDNASSVAKVLVPREVFVKQIMADRQSVGTLTSRQLGGVSSSVSDGVAAKGSLATPAGTYINVAFSTRFGSKPQPVRELVSFHLDADQKWRVTGYTLR